MIDPREAFDVMEYEAWLDSIEPSTPYDEVEYEPV